MYRPSFFLATWDLRQFLGHWAFLGGLNIRGKGKVNWVRQTYRWGSKRNKWFGCMLVVVCVKTNNNFQVVDFDMSKLTMTDSISTYPFKLMSLLTKAFQDEGFNISNWIIHNFLNSFNDYLGIFHWMISRHKRYDISDILEIFYHSLNIYISYLISYLQPNQSNIFKDFFPSSGWQISYNISCVWVIGHNVSDMMVVAS